MANELIEVARKRYETAKSYWSEIYRAYDEDARATHVVGGSWDKDIKAAREADGRPALEFNELHTHVAKVSNRTRQRRPSIKIGPGDKGDPDTAEIIESKIRHIQYASQADVAYDCAVNCSATGGFGFFRIAREYVTDNPSASAFLQEPRFRRILDPKTVLFDPAVVEPDFSDAKYCFVRRRVPRADFRDEFGKDPVPFESRDDAWGDDEEGVWIAEYWHVETRAATLCQLRSGEIVFLDQLKDGERDQIVNKRPLTERTVYCDIIDGEKLLEDDDDTRIWPARWIGIVPVLGREIIVEGKRHLQGIVRHAVGSQKLKNVYGSGIAEAIGTANHSPFIGPAGSFKDKKWRDHKRHFFYEYTPVMGENGQMMPPPQRDTSEPPIQALTAAFLQSTDSIRRSVGYMDTVINPSQNDLSGVAVERREDQQDLTNFDIEDNLERSQWHAGRIVLDLLKNLTDTPRPWTVRKEDGSVRSVPVTMQMEGQEQPPQVPGFEGEPHYRIDAGDYDVTISTGPSYPAQRDEERDAILRLAETNPAAWALYGDIIWDLMGYKDLAERAKMGLAPQVQQAIAAKLQNIPPAAQAQIAQLTQQNQFLKQGLQKLLTMLQTKQIEAQGKLQVEKLKAVKEVTVEGMKANNAMAQQVHQHGHETNLALLDTNGKAIEVLMNMLHESELTPSPAEQLAIQQAGAAQKEPKAA